MTDAAAEERRLVWMCRRGMRELDVVLGRFLREVYPGADPALRAGFRALLERQDPEILAFLLGKATPDDDRQRSIVEYLRGSN